MRYSQVMSRCVWQVRAAIDASPLKCPEAIGRGLIDRGLYRDQVINSLARQESSKDPAPTSAGIHPPAKAQAETVTLNHLPRVGVKRYIMHQERQKVGAHRRQYACLYALCTSMCFFCNKACSFNFEALCLGPWAQSPGQDTPF